MKKLTIGRSPESDIQVSQAFPRVSNNHATIELIEGTFFLTDHSTNGTTVNGRNINQQQVPLANGDDILLAGVYRLAWPVILNFFPADDNSIRRTVRFDANSFAAAQAANQVPANQIPANQAPVNQAAPQPEPARPAPFPAPSPAPFPAPAPVNDAPRNHGYNPAVASSNEAGQLNSVTQSDIDDALNRFSPAAALGTWFWGLFNGIYWPLAIIPLSLIPFVGQVLSIFLCTYMGLNGNRLGWQKAQNISFPQWMKKQQALLWIGIFIFLFCTAAQLFAFYWIMNYIF